MGEGGAGSIGAVRTGSGSSPVSSTPLSELLADTELMETIKRMGLIGGPSVGGSVIDSPLEGDL